jgi:hypothetical protein
VSSIVENCLFVKVYCARCDTKGKEGAIAAMEEELWRLTAKGDASG